jgi:leader peptidase (prepilin peptidase)/N-methyltransferase
MRLDTLLVALAGLVLGALLNIVIIRLPRERNLGGWPRCTGCGRPLAWWQILPLAGWLAQAGRARCCGKPLRWIYPLVELLTAVSLAWLYMAHGLTPLFAYLAFVVAVLVVTGAIDWLHRWIYTAVVLGGAAITLAASVVTRHHSFANALTGLLVAGFVFVIFFMIARILFPAHGAPFGLGDVYLAIFLGAAFGISRIGAVLLSGMLLAGLYSVAIVALRAAGRPTPQYISYGTFLCLGAIGYLLLVGF